MGDEKESEPSVAVANDLNSLDQASVVRRLARAGAHQFALRDETLLKLTEIECKILNDREGESHPSHYFFCRLTRGCSSKEGSNA